MIGQGVEDTLDGRDELGGGVYCVHRLALGLEPDHRAQAGEVSRHERDTTGDGFRDSVGYYTAGRLESEKQDLDGDGHMEITLYYDEREQLARREEDVDRDGDADVVSHYEAGRLTSRELLDPEALERSRQEER